MDPNHPLMSEPYFKLKISRKLRDWFLKPEGISYSIGTTKIWWESDFTLEPLPFFHISDLDPSVNIP